jgi:hypothetical protein
MQDAGGCRMQSDARGCRMQKDTGGQEDAGYLASSFCILLHPSASLCILFLPVSLCRL